MKEFCILDKDEIDGISIGQVPNLDFSMAKS